MASKKALQWLAEQGIRVEHRAEAHKFNVGTANRAPFHVVRVDTRYNDVRSMGWYTDKTEALAACERLQYTAADAADAFGRGGADYVPGRTITYYVRDNRTDETVVR